MDNQNLVKSFQQKKKIRHLSTIVVFLHYLLTLKMNAMTNLALSLYKLSAKRCRDQSKTIASFSLRRLSLKVV